MLRKVVIAALVTLCVVPGILAVSHFCFDGGRPNYAVVWSPVEKNVLRERLSPKALEACMAFRAKKGGDRLEEASIFLGEMVRPPAPPFAVTRNGRVIVRYLSRAKPALSFSISECVELWGPPDKSPDHHDYPLSQDCNLVIYDCGRTWERSRYKQLIRIFSDKQTGLVKTISFYDTGPHDR